MSPKKLSIQDLAFLLTETVEEPPVEETPVEETVAETVEEPAIEVVEEAVEEVLPSTVTVEKDGIKITWQVIVTQDPKQTCQEWETPYKKWGSMNPQDYYYRIGEASWHRTSFEYLDQRIQESGQFRLDYLLSKWENFYFPHLIYAHELGILPLVRDKFSEYYAQEEQNTKSYNRIAFDYMKFLLGEGECPSFTQPPNTTPIYAREFRKAVQTARETSYYGGTKWDWSHKTIMDECSNDDLAKATHVMWVPQDLDHYEVRKYVREEGTWIPIKLVA